MKKIDLKILLIPLFLFPLYSCSGNAGHADDDHESHDDHEHTAGELILSPRKASELGIETEEALPAGFREVIKAGGIITPSSSDFYTLTARKSGVVTLSPGVVDGKGVKGGERLATISSDGMQGGDPSLAASLNLSAAKEEYQRLKSLYEQRLVTADKFKEAERLYNEAKALAGQNNTSGTIAISSPYSGTLTDLYVSSGQYVETGEPIATVTKNSLMTLRADLPARFASRISSIETANFIPEGSEHTLSLQEMEGKKISGETAVSAQGGYVPVYFSFSGTPVESPPGYATVFLIGRNKEGVISVPREALLELQGNKYLYIVEDGHEYEKRKVTTGADNGERVEITSGLSAGEIFVAKGASVVRMAEVSAVAPPSHTHNH